MRVWSRYRREHAGVWALLLGLGCESRLAAVADGVSEGDASAPSVEVPTTESMTPGQPSPNEASDPDGVGGNPSEGPTAGTPNPDVTSGSPDGSPAPDGSPEPAQPGNAEPDCSQPIGAGAPVPLRRLTAAQVERTVQRVLGVRATLDVQDEQLQTFKSNISSSIDVAAARAYHDFALRVAAASDPLPCEANCIDVLLDEVGAQLFRRPLTAEQREIYTALFDDDAANGDPREGARLVIEAMLQSPSFLYLDEVTDAEGALDGYGVAARLSLTLWGQNPDRALLERAERGELSTATAVAEETQRLLADPRSLAGLSEFINQWLGLHRLDNPDSRPDLAALGPEALAALASEPSELFRQLVLNEGNLEDLLTTRRTVPFAALDPVYGSDVLERTAEHVELDPERRAGLLSLPGVMAALAHAEHTSPTLRGHAVMANFFCSPPPPPPVGLDVTLPDAGPNATARERLELHSSDITCGSCHRTMDGIGFAFESYDWLGRFRSEEHGKPIDATSSFVLGGQEVTIDGAVALVQLMSENSTVAACVARQWTRYAAGVTESKDAACLLQRLTTEVTAAGGLKNLITSSLTSDWLRRLPGEAQ